MALLMVCRKAQASFAASSSARQNNCRCLLGRLHPDIPETEHITLRVVGEASLLFVVTPTTAGRSLFVVLCFQECHGQRSSIIREDRLVSFPFCLLPRVVSSGESQFRGVFSRTKPLGVPIRGTTQNRDSIHDAPCRIADLRSLLIFFSCSLLSFFCGSCFTHSSIH